MTRLHFVADENLALVDYFFADYGQIELYAGRQLTTQQVQGADALLIRSVTRVDDQLLGDCPPRFIGTATIGTDHLDLSALHRRKIAWANAAGCNAQAVAEYVVTAILTLQPQQLHAGEQFTLGVVGLGNVGRRLVSLGRRLGWQVLGYDPFVQLGQTDGFRQCSDLDQVLVQADAISLHVPLTRTGVHPTFHLITEPQLARMPGHAMLINSARGPVIAEADLMADIRRTRRPVVLDVFEHEPRITSDLLDLLALATPHIAGYSLEGKARGTQMVFDAWCQWQGLTSSKDFRTQLPAVPALGKPCSLTTALADHLTSLYDIRRDDAALRACVVDGQVSAQAFDQLRRDYPLRREWAAFGL